jgi:hypothetical protein
VTAVGAGRLVVASHVHSGRTDGVDPLDYQAVGGAGVRERHDRARADEGRRAHQEAVTGAEGGQHAVASHPDPVEVPAGLAGYQGQGDDAANHGPEGP